jgi:small redox-active disulfide protein 2
MRIEVLGTGCAKCRKVEQIIRDTVSKTGIDAEVVHVSNLSEIVERGVMMTPAVIIDGVKKLEGKVPSEEQVRGWLAK